MPELKNFTNWILYISVPNCLFMYWFPGRPNKVWLSNSKFNKDNCFTWGIKKAFYSLFNKSKCSISRFIFINIAQCDNTLLECARFDKVLLLYYSQGGYKIINRDYILYGSRLKIYGLVRNHVHQHIFGLITNNGLNFEVKVDHDSKILSNNSFDQSLMYGYRFCCMPVWTQSSSKITILWKMVRLKKAKF